MHPRFTAIGLCIILTLIGLLISELRHPSKGTKAFHSGMVRFYIFIILSTMIIVGTPEFTSILNARRYTHWVHTAAPTSPPSETWTGTFQDAPMRIIMTRRANPYPEPWTGTVSLGSPWDSHHTYVFHAVEILHHRRGTTTILGTIDHQRLVGTIVWHTIHRHGDHHFFKIFPWRTLPYSQWTWQGTLDGIPYTLHD